MSQSYTARDKALADPEVPSALKRLLTEIVPRKDFDALRALVETGEIDPLYIPPNHPLVSATSVLISAEDPVKWLSVLFSAAPESFFEARVASSDYYGTNIDRFDINRNYGTIQQLPLASFVIKDTKTPVTKLLEILPEIANKLLRTPFPQQRVSGQPEEVLLHHMVSGNEFTVETLDKLEKLTGGDDFLMIRNARGETLFHRLASNAGWSEDSDRLDMAGWMLQRKPLLVNDPDRFGFTPLDRLVMNSHGKVDTAMGRLLLASGAKLEKQIAPGFNLKAALQEHSETRLDKAPIRRAATPGLSQTP